MWTETTEGRDLIKEISVEMVSQIAGARRESRSISQQGGIARARRGTATLMSSFVAQHIGG